MVLHQGPYALLLRPCKARRAASSHPAPPRAARRAPARAAPRTISRAPPPGPWVRRPGETACAIVCGQLSSVTVNSLENLELTM